MKLLLTFFIEMLKTSPLMWWPHAVADDRKVPPGRIFTGPASGYINRGEGSSNRFKNFLFSIAFPFSDSICGKKFVDGIFTRTTPVGDADWETLPMGAICLHLPVTSKVVTDGDYYIRKAGGWEKVQTDGAISITDEDGVYLASYETLADGIAALAAGDTLKLKAGVYEADEIDITEPGWCQIVGEPGTIIEGASGADYCLRTVFGAISSTKGLTVKGITFDHSDDATQVGLDIANASATGRINLYLEDCNFESNGGDSLYTLHASTSASIRMYIRGCWFEGPVEYTVGNTDDRIRFDHCELIGGLVTGTSATAMEIYLGHCKVLHQGITGGNGAQLMYMLYCMSVTDTNPEVYAALDNNDTAGSQTDTVLFPTS